MLFIGSERKEEKNRLGRNSVIPEYFFLFSSWPGVSVLGFASRVDVYCLSTSQWLSSRLRHSQLLWGEVGGMSKGVCNRQDRLNKWVVKACTSAGETEKGQKEATHNTHISCNALFCAPIFLLSLCYARLNRARAKKMGMHSLAFTTFVFVCVHGVDIE